MSEQITQIAVIAAIQNKITHGADRGLVVTCNGKLLVYYTLNVHAPQVEGRIDDKSTAC